MKEIFGRLRLGIKGKRGERGILEGLKDRLKRVALRTIFSL